MKRVGGLVAAGLAILFATSDSKASNLDWSLLDLPRLNGEPFDPAELIGHLVLVVNTASLCGFTSQYEGLQSLWETYRDEGLVVLGVPSDDFGGQEYNTDEEVKTFCEVNFGISFPMLERQKVKGRDAHPLFAWISEQAGPLGTPRWNFYKYLIAPDGSLVDWYPSTTIPQSSALIGAVEEQLAVLEPQS
jgi:glutathione peroxidase